MLKSLTPLFDFLIAFLEIRKRSIYVSFFTRSILNDEFTHCIHRLKKSKALLKKLYWIYSALKYFFYPISLSSESTFYCKDIYFVVSSSDKWVLRGLANDLCEELNQLGNKINYSIASFESLPEFDQYTHFIAMHQSIGVKLLKNNKIADHQVSIYYTHTRSLTQDLVAFYNRCHRIFFQSPIDLNLLISNQLQVNKSVLLPIGYSPSVFNCTALSPADKQYDFVVSLPYQQRFENIHYYDRKNLQNIERILFYLSKSYRILVLGSNWDKSYFAQMDNISCIDVDYKDKSKYYLQANTFLCLSRLEGGPIPLLEALASGCYVITTNVGFSSMLNSSSPNIYLLSCLDNSPAITAELIIQIYEAKFKTNSFTSSAYSQTNSLVNSHSFRALSQILHDQFI